MGRKLRWGRKGCENENGEMLTLKSRTMAGG